MNTQTFKYWFGVKTVLVEGFYPLEDALYFNNARIKSRYLQILTDSTQK